MIRLFRTLIARVAPQHGGQRVMLEAGIDVRGRRDEQSDGRLAGQRPG